MWCDPTHKITQHRPAGVLSMLWQEKSCVCVCVFCYFCIYFVCLMKTALSVLAAAGPSVSGSHNMTRLWCGNTRSQGPGSHRPATTSVCLCVFVCVCMCEREIHVSTSTTPLLPSLTYWMQQLWLAHIRRENIQCWINLVVTDRWTCFRNTLSFSVNVLCGSWAWITSVNTSCHSQYLYLLLLGWHF